MAGRELRVASPPLSRATPALHPLARRLCARVCAPLLPRAGCGARLCLHALRIGQVAMEEPQLSERAREEEDAVVVASHREAIKAVAAHRLPRRLAVACRHVHRACAGRVSMHADKKQAAPPGLAKRGSDGARGREEKGRGRRRADRQ
jgi:hypothetical protein